jgi:hypothetical protein
MSYEKKIVVAGVILLAITICMLIAYIYVIIPKYLLLINIGVDFSIFLFIIYCIYKDKKESKEEERKIFEAKKTGETYEAYQKWLKNSKI